MFICSFRAPGSLITKLPGISQLLVGLDGTALILDDGKSRECGSAWLTGRVYFWNVVVSLFLRIRCACNMYVMCWADEVSNWERQNNTVVVHGKTFIFQNRIPC